MTSTTKLTFLGRYDMDCHDGVTDDALAGLVIYEVQSIAID